MPIDGLITTEIRCETDAKQM